MSRKKGFLALMLLAAFYTNVVWAKTTPAPRNDIQPTAIESSVCRMVVNMIGAENYKKVILNDSLSVLVFDRYLNRIDQNRSYLLEEDVASFDLYRTQFDDDLKAGNLTHAFAMYNTYKRRYEERLQYALNQLLNEFNFSEKDVYVRDRRKMPFIKTRAAMNLMWKQRVKYDLLELQLESKDMGRNKEILKKRYQALLEQSGKTSSQDIFQLFMNAYTASVDPHVAYFNPFNSSQFNVEASRTLEGIGAALVLENEFVTIKTLTPGGPAYKTRLLNPDDRIIAISQGKDGQFQDIFGWRLDNTIALIRGPKGTTVRLKVLAKGKDLSEAPQVVEVIRDKIVLEDQSAKQEIRNYKNNGKEVKIGVITIPSFYMDYVAMQRRETNYKSTTRDVKLLLDTLIQKKVDGIMIDLRGNGGGALNEAISLTGLFIPSGPVVQLRDASQNIQVSEDRDTTTFYRGPLAVLVDRTSASASEIFAAAIQDYGRGLVLGAQTYGKGSAQGQEDLDKAALKLKDAGSVAAEPGQPVRYGQLNLTVGKFYRITGSSTQHKGVSPDIEMPTFIAQSKYGEDNETSAMPWDTIGKSNYVRIGSVSKVLPVLKSMYQQRNSTSPAYQAFSHMVTSYRENEVPKPISLNGQEFKRLREVNAKKALDESNRLREAMGLPILKKGEARPKTDDLDFVKSEAGQVLTDYISLTKTPSGM